MLLANKQWGLNYEGSILNLPITANLKKLVGMHEGTGKQVVTYNQLNNTFVGSSTGNAIWWIAICSL